MRVVVYMGDDEQFEYIYRYVSNLPWRRSRRSEPSAAEIIDAPTSRRSGP